MPQISLYVNDTNLSQIEEAAKNAHKSISGWVLEKVLLQLKPSYSQEFVDVFGAVKDDSFQRPEQPQSSENIPREIL